MPRAAFMKQRMREGRRTRCRRHQRSSLGSGDRDRYRPPPDRPRPSPANDLAARLFGAEFKQVSAQLPGIQLALNTATAANREFVRGKADALANISKALAARAVA